MTASRAKKSGNSFVLRVIGIFVLVHFLILSRPPAEKVYLNQTIGHDKHTLEVLKRHELQELETLKLEKRNHIFGAPAASMNDSSKPKARALIPVPVAAISPQTTDLEQVRDPLTDDKIRGVQRRIADIDKDWVLLEQAKYERTFKIPGTDASLGEADIKNFYPLGLALSLLGIGIYRRALLRAPNDDQFIPPIWAAPIPFYRYSIHLLRWLLLNVVGLALIGTLCILFLNFSRRDEFFASGLWAFINTGMACVTLVFYVWQTVRAICGRAAETQRRAASA